MSTSLLYFLFLTSMTKVHGLCGSNIRWEHHLNIEDVYGMWYGIGYFQHTPDMTNMPNEIGCVTLYITDATAEVNYDWLNWSTYRRNYTDQNWRSYRNNPWSDTPLAGSWLDIRVKRRAKRDMYTERRLRVLWDEDGQTMEQTYVYSPQDPGLWTTENMRPMEREMRQRGIDIWYPDDPPRHPEVIRVLKVTPQRLTINHCSETGNGGVFSLVLRRSPASVGHREWYEMQRQLYSYELPKVYRQAPVCAACSHFCSVVYLSLLGILVKFL